MVKSQKTCKALVLEAGADLGAYEAGIIKGLIQQFIQHQNSTEGVEWDVFSGVSVGSINSAFLNTFAKNETIQMGDQIVSLWEQIKASDVFKNYFPGGILQGLIFEPSLFDTTPLHNYITTQLSNRTQQRLLNIAACNANKATFDRFNETLSQSDLIQAIMSSSAVPAAFPYQFLNQQPYFDGGTISYLDIYGAVMRCRDLGVQDEQITVDIITLSNDQKNMTLPENPNVLDVFALYERDLRQIKNFKQVIEAFEYMPNVNFRFLIKPTKPLPFNHFSFKKEDIQFMINLGLSDAQYYASKYFNQEQKSQSEFNNISEDFRQFLIEGYQYEFEKYGIQV